jgi:hypothetical protein
MGAAMKLSNRLDRIERDVAAKVRALMPDDEALTQRGLRVRRMLDYVGLPASEWDTGMAARRRTENHIAQIRLSTGCDRRTAIVRQSAESHELTEAAADEWLRRLVEVGKATEHDMEAGTLFRDSEAGARLRRMLEFGPKAGAKA